MKFTRIAAAASTAAIALTVAACGSSSSSSSTTSTTAAFPATTTTAASTQSINGLPSLAACQQTVRSQTHTPGVLTAATDNPVYTPWFVDNTPSNGRGYESAVAYDVASLLGFPHTDVKWVTEPFDQSYAPGSKSFDFDINEISVTPDRSKVVAFSDSYYDTTQSIVALKSNPIVTKHSPADLKTYLYGDQIGSTGLAYINTQIQPTQAPRVYNTLDDAVDRTRDQADRRHRGRHARRPVHGHLRGKGAVQVGQFPSTGEHYGLLLQQGNPLVTCVDSAPGHPDPERDPDQAERPVPRHRTTPSPDPALGTDGHRARNVRRGDGGPAHQPVREPAPPPPGTIGDVRQHHLDPDPRRPPRRIPRVTLGPHVPGVLPQPPPDVAGLRR